MDWKKPRPQSWPECLTPDNGSQTENKSCDHRAEINQAKYELIVLQKQLLKYNKETFGRFMQNLIRNYEKRIKKNNQLHQEISKMKAQVQGIEKALSVIELTWKWQETGVVQIYPKQARGIRSDIEELLTREVDRYFNKKNRQKIKIEANTTSDGSNILFQLDGFEKQLEEHELHVQQQENNIKKTIETQVAEERKCLKDEYDALMARKESEYNNCMIDMKQKIYSFKHQLEDQHKSCSNDLERQYKSRISALEKPIVIKDKEIDVIFAKDLKIIALNDKIIFYASHIGRDLTIEPNSYFSYHDIKLWTGKREDAKNDLNIQKKYTFRMRV
ncbi:hypothetical protein C1645_835194 [Glomus cerebriforme]|uniref:Uncharacterized protein n=1 Tax=Glomus cerebriforme TaxID=658196 RepID=A0A397SAQ8_9GLOM|nr:hypothetical protein C1645_835194 [Glomus cerebriforme]